MVPEGEAKSQQQLLQLVLGKVILSRQSRDLDFQPFQESFK